MSFYSTCSGGCNKGGCNGAFNSCPCVNPFCCGFGTTPTPLIVYPSVTPPVTNVLLRTANFANTVGATTVAIDGLIPFATTRHNNSVGRIVNNVNTVTLNETGVYNVNYCLTIRNTLATANTISVALRQNSTTMTETIQTYSVDGNATIGLCGTAQVVVGTSPVITDLINLSSSAIDVLYGNITFTKIA